MSIGGRSVARLVPRLAEAATGALVLAVFAIGFLPADLLAAVPRNSIDDDSRPAFELSGWLHYVQLVPEQQPTVTPSAPTVVPDAVVAPVPREKPAAQPPTPAAEKTNTPAEQAQPKPQAEKPVEQAQEQNAQEQKAQDNPQEKPEAPAVASNASKSDAKPGSGGVVGTVQDWFARANREFQNVIIKDLSVPSPGTTKAEDEIAKKLKDTKEEEAKKAEDARRQQQADEQAKQQAKRDDEKKKLAEKAAETERKKAEEEAKKAADALKKKADEEAKKAAAAAKPAPDVAQTAPQPPADADAAAKEKARIAEELRKTEQAQQDDARKKLEAQKAEAEKASRAEKERLEAQRQADEAKRLAEERRNSEAIIAEEKRKRDAAAAEQRRLTEDLRKAEEAQKQAEKSVERVQPPPVEQVEPKAGRKVVITPEPVQRPELQGETYRPELKGKKPTRSIVEQSVPDPDVTLPRAKPRVAFDDGGVSLGTVSTKVRKRRIKLYRVAEARVPYRGTAVKRWVYRAPMGLGGCRAAGRVSTPPSRYTVASGDSLWRISDSHYHSGARWNRIYRANRDRISDPDLIYPCQRFTVPGRR